MQPNLSISQNLETTWQPVIEHQFNLTLAPLVSSISNPRVAFSEVEGHNGKQFVCELTGRFASGVSCYTFMKRTGTVGYPNGMPARAIAHIAAMAEAEGLDGHAASVRQRG